MKSNPQPTRPPFINFSLIMMIAFIGWSVQINYGSELRRSFGLKAIEADETDRYQPIHREEFERRPVGQSWEEIAREKGWNSSLSKIEFDYPGRETAWQQLIRKRWHALLFCLAGSAIMMGAAHALKGNTTTTFLILLTGPLILFFNGAHESYSEKLE